MSWGLQLLRRLVDAFAPPEPFSARRPGDAAPETNDDDVEMARERELRIVMMHWL